MTQAQHARILDRTQRWLVREFKKAWKAKDLRWYRELQGRAKQWGREVDRLAARSSGK